MKDVDSYLLDIKQLKSRQKEKREQVWFAELHYVMAKDALDHAAFIARGNGASISAIARALGTVDTRTAKNAIKRGAEIAAKSGVQF